MKLSYECDMRWNDLDGPSRTKRHCARCDHDVYNLSAMTRGQAASLLASFGDKKPCVHFRQRDGRIVHHGDPRDQLAAQREGARRLAAVALAAQAAFLGFADDPFASLFDPFNHIAQMLTAEPEPEFHYDDSGVTGLMF